MSTNPYYSIEVTYRLYLLVTARSPYISGCFRRVEAGVLSSGVSRDVLLLRHGDHRSFTPTRAALIQEV